MADDQTMELIFILIRPDGAEMGLAGEVITKFENQGFTLKGLKMINVDRPFAEKHYQDVRAKLHFVFIRLVDCILTGPVVAMVWEGVGVIPAGRKIIQEIDPPDDFTDPNYGSHLIEGSDSLESAIKDNALWFPDPDAVSTNDKNDVVRSLYRLLQSNNFTDTGGTPVTGFDTMEQTLILINPYTTHTGLVSNIICSFDRQGFTMKGLKMITVDQSLAEEYYQHLSAKAFYPHLANCISSGAVVAMIWEGKNVVSTGKNIIGKTIPYNDRGSNLIYGSHSEESANEEIAWWFPDGLVHIPSEEAQCDIGRISVTGFDNDLPHEDVNVALRDHFASCGKITDVCIDEMKCIAYIYFVGEGAVDKALELSGAQVNGGWIVCCKAFPFYDDGKTLLAVQGFNHSLPNIVDLLTKHFTLCGKVPKVDILGRASVITIKGFDAVEKALKLSGSIVGKRKIVVKCLSRPPRYTVHNRRFVRYD